MSNKVYDVLKFVAQVFLPALGTLYLGLSKIWGFPYGEEVVGTITTVDLFLGAVLGISSVKYYKDGKDVDGTITVDGNAQLQLPENVTFEDLAGKQSVKFTVDASNYLGKHEG